MSERHVIICGVAGSGKTTVSELVAAKLGWPCVEADDFHGSNRDKMARGEALTDADRWPWLDRLNAHLKAQAGPSVLACSALKAAYRARLGDGLVLSFAFLDVPPAVVAARLAARQGHYFGAGLMDSQFAILEPPADALRCDATLPPEVIVDQILAWIGRSDFGETGGR
jgi:gluconokinase